MQTDPFIEDFLHENTTWIVTLNDGTIHYDDPRITAWLELKKKCEAEGKYIDKIVLKFRSHYETLDKAKGYTFIKSALGSFGSNKTINYYVFGFKNDNFKVQKWRIPELIKEREELRDFNQYKEFYIGGTASS